MILKRITTSIRQYFCGLLVYDVMILQNENDQEVIKQVAKYFKFKDSEINIAIKKYLDNGKK